MGIVVWGDWPGLEAGIGGRYRNPDPDRERSTMSQPPEAHFTICPDALKRLTNWMTADGLNPAYDPVAYGPALEAALDAASAAYELQFKKVFRERYTGLRQR